MSKKWSSYEDHQEHSNSWRTFIEEGDFTENSRWERYLNEERFILTEQEKEDLLREIWRGFRRQYSADDNLKAILAAAGKSQDPEVMDAAAELEAAMGDEGESSEPTLGDPASVEVDDESGLGPAIPPERVPATAPARPRSRSAAPATPEDAPEPAAYLQSRERRRPRSSLQEKLIATITEAILNNIKKSTRK